VQRFSNTKIIIRELASVIQESGILVIQDRKSHQQWVELIQMNYFGTLIGHAVEKVGKKKAAQKLIIMDLILTSIRRNQENMSGLIGESKSSSRKQSPLFGKRNLINNTHMIKTLYSRS
jgi:hypothetical protein